MTVRPILSALLLGLALAACGGKGAAPADEHGHAPGKTGEDGAPAAQEAKAGEHGGRLLEQDGLAVELAVSEDGTPPKYQAWLYRDGKPLPATDGTVQVRLTRLGGIGETHVLKPGADGSLMAATVVGEPHSFDMEVTATVQGTPLRWAYPSYEGRTVIAAAMARTSGIKAAPAAPGAIADTHQVQGLVTPVQGRTARVMARYPGQVRSLRANIGDRVTAGQVLATVNSNLSLTDYAVAAPIGGVVMSREASVGSVAVEGAPLFEIADLSEVWVDLHVFGRDAQHIAAGARVQVTRMGDGATAETVIERVLPGTATASQSTIARARLRNADGLWRPGSAVAARITVSARAARLLVPLAALQTFRDWEVVFIRVGDTYEVRPVQLGQRDATSVEVLSGLEPGDQVVVAQSYLVKADVEKAGANHDH